MRQCPVCGSAEWGSGTERDGSLTRLCHGRLSVVGKKSGELYYYPCPVRWHQTQDADFGVENFLPDPHAPTTAVDRVAARRRLRRVK